MATRAAANTSFFFNQIADAPLEEAKRLAATIGSFTVQQRFLAEFTIDPCGFVEAVMRGAPRLPELTPVRTYLIFDGPAMEVFSKQKEIDEKIPGGLSIDPQEVGQVDGALTDFLSKFAESKSETLKKAAAAFHLAFRKIEQNDTFVSSLSSPPLPNSKEEKVSFIRARMTTNVKVDAVEESLIAGCKSAEDIANRVIPFLIATIQASPLTSRVTEGQDGTAPAKERFDHIGLVVFRAIQHLALTTKPQNLCDEMLGASATEAGKLIADFDRNYAPYIIRIAGEILLNPPAFIDSFDRLATKLQGKEIQIDRSQEATAKEEVDLSKEIVSILSRISQKTVNEIVANRGKWEENLNVLFWRSPADAAKDMLPKFSSTQQQELASCKTAEDLFTKVVPILKAYAETHSVKGRDVSDLFSVFCDFCAKVPQ